MARPDEISKYDLDISIYGELYPSKEKYEILGFIETSADNKADAFMRAIIKFVRFVRSQHNL